MLVPTKKWYASKLFWLGILQMIGGVSELLVQYLEHPEVGVGMVISGIITIIFRYVTKQPITFGNTSAKNLEDSIPRF